MDDANSHTPDTSDTPHGEGDFAAWMRAALDDGGAGGAFGDEALMEAVESDDCAALLDDAELRADVADIRAALADVDEAPEGLSPSVRTAALAAFDRSVAVESTATATVRPQTAAPRVRERVLVTSAARPRFTRTAWYAAAALIMVAVGIGYLAGEGVLSSDRGVESAHAGLRLDALELRHRHESGVTVEEGRVLKLGETFTPDREQLISFGFGRTSRVVVGDNGAVRVGSDDEIPSEVLAQVVAEVGKRPSALLRLQSGEAELRTHNGPILLAVGNHGVLMLRRGSCHVAVTSGAPVIELDRDGAARYFRAGETPVDLAGDESARRVFRDLDLFGGEIALPSAANERHVDAALWRILDGPIARSGGRFRIDLRKEGEALLAWTPPGLLSRARALRVGLRAPLGSSVHLAHRVTSGELEDLGRARVTLTADTRADEPGLATIDLMLPADWYHRLSGGELVLVIEGPAQGPDKNDGAVGPEEEGPGGGTSSNGRWAWFDGVSFVMDDLATDRK